jgi:hypothetical protein
VSYLLKEVERKKRWKLKHAREDERRKTDLKKKTMGKRERERRKSKSGFFSSFFLMSLNENTK